MAKSCSRIGQYFVEMEATTDPLPHDQKNTSQLGPLPRLNMNVIATRMEEKRGFGPPPCTFPVTQSLGLEDEVRQKEKSLTSPGEDSAREDGLRRPQFRRSGLAEALVLGVDRSRIAVRKTSSGGKAKKPTSKRNYWDTVLGSTPTEDFGVASNESHPTEFSQRDTPMRFLNLKPLKLNHYLDSPAKIDFSLSTLTERQEVSRATSSLAAGKSPLPHTPEPIDQKPNPSQSGANQISSHSNIQVKSFACRDCKLRFATRGELSSHSGICPLRQEDRPFKCNHCGACFRKNSNLIKHISLVELKLRPHVCPECKATFGQKSNLTAHIRTIHNGERKFACEIDGCDRRFGQNSGLRAHVRTVHLGARDFVCECSRRFGSRGDLNRHIRSTHQKLLPFPCFECGKAFSRKSVLLRHLTAVHGKSKSQLPEASGKQKL